MKLFKHAPWLALLGMGCLALSYAAESDKGEVRVLCSNGIRVAVEKLTPEAEKIIGRKISIEFSASSMLKKSIEGGAPFDLAILTPGIIDDLSKSGKIVSGSHTDIASADLAVGVKASSPKADISTPDAIKLRLLAARSLTWTDGGAAGGAIIGMLKALGIQDQVQSKIVLQKAPGRASESVAGGENELVFAPISEIVTVNGVEVLGKFPKEFQSPVVMTAGIGAQAKDADGAKALVKFLTSAKAVPAIKSTGMDPAKK
jgi:molybdate transport system substrate-binding protein